MPPRAKIAPRAGFAEARTPSSSPAPTTYRRATWRFPKGAPLLSDSQGKRLDCLLCPRHVGILLAWGGRPAPRTGRLAESCPSSALDKRRAPPAPMVGGRWSRCPSHGRGAYNFSSISVRTRRPWMTSSVLPLRSSSGSLRSLLPRAHPESLWRSGSCSRSGRTP